jgi:hypothetical protein
MKKLSILAVLALLVISPLTSFAKTVISDSELDNMTAETGVSITFNNVAFWNTVNLTAVSWGDNDGFTGNTNPGYAGFTNLSLIGYPNVTTIRGTATVDIGTSGSSTVISLGLPNTGPYNGYMEAFGNITLSGNKNLSSGGQLCSVEFVHTILSGGGTVQMFTQAGQGIDFNFNNVTLIGNGLFVFSLGDTNGFTGNTSPGYFGMGLTTITGNVARLVNTTAALDVGSSGAVTSVNIAMPTITIGAMNVTGQLLLGSEKSLGVLAAGSVGTLGIVDIRGFSTQASGSIQVFAH